MAKPLPNEDALYERIRDEKITIPPFIWDAMYNLLGDSVSFINFQVSYYLDQNKPIPVEDSRKILDYVMRSVEIVRKIICPERITDKDASLQKVKREGTILNPLIREFYTHYLGNDLHIMGLCVQYYLDPAGERPIPVADARKILDATLSMRKFLNRLRQATSPSIAS
ncbi:MAG: hypothetical protein HQL12_01785 [Candidatus Omnitrophica bacterium]|nr:hypothetical protein [Candidatus Omnitrophota bacterium]